LTGPLDDRRNPVGVEAQIRGHPRVARGSQPFETESLWDSTRWIILRAPGWACGAGQRQQTLASLKELRRQTPRHVLIKDLPEADRFSQLRTDKKHFVDTIKLLAYRSETALALVAREKLARLDDARAFIRQVFQSAADLRPNHQLKTLTVRVHRLTTASHDTVLEHLCKELTATETTFPGTDLRLIYQLVGSG
jgi:hypothetical protein